jgi:hypothetical protein
MNYNVTSITLNLNLFILYYVLIVGKKSVILIFIIFIIIT